MQRRLVVLVRGINVGAHNRISMADLRRAAAGAGMSDPSTVLQSGNIVGVATAPNPALQRQLETALAQLVAASPRVVIRTDSEFRAVAGADPFDAEPVAPAHRMVAFFRSRVDGDRIRRLEARLGPSDRMHASAMHADLLLPAGLLGSGLARVNFDDLLGTTVTLRNRTTVARIANALAAG